MEAIQEALSRSESASSNAETGKNETQERVRNALFDWVTERLADDILADLSADVVLDHILSSERGTAVIDSLVEEVKARLNEHIQAEAENKLEAEYTEQLNELTETTDASQADSEPAEAGLEADEPTDSGTAEATETWDIAADTEIADEEITSSETEAIAEDVVEEKEESSTIVEANDPSTGDEPEQTAVAENAVDTFDAEVTAAEAESENESENEVEKLVESFGEFPTDSEETDALPSDGEPDEDDTDLLSAFGGDGSLPAETEEPENDLKVIQEDEPSDEVAELPDVQLRPDGINNDFETVTHGDEEDAFDLQLQEEAASLAEREAEDSDDADEDGGFSPINWDEEDEDAAEEEFSYDQLQSKVEQADREEVIPSSDAGIETREKQTVEVEDAADVEDLPVEEIPAPEGFEDGSIDLDADVTADTDAEVASDLVEDAPEDAHAEEEEDSKELPAQEDDIYFARAILGGTIDERSDAREMFTSDAYRLEPGQNFDVLVESVNVAEREDTKSSTVLARVVETLPKNLPIIPLEEVRPAASLDELEESVVAQLSDLKSVLKMRSEQEEWQISVLMDKEELRRYVVDHHPPVRELLEEMRGKPQGVARFLKKKMISTINEEVERRADACADKVYEKLKKRGDSARRMEWTPTREGAYFTIAHIVGLFDADSQDTIVEITGELAEEFGMYGFIFRPEGPIAPRSFGHNAKG